MMRTSHSISSDIFRFELALFPVRRGRICCDDGDVEEGDIEELGFRRGVEGANAKEELGRIRRVCAPHKHRLPVPNIIPFNLIPEDYLSIALPLPSFSSSVQSDLMLNL